MLPAELQHHGGDRPAAVGADLLVGVLGGLLVGVVGVLAVEISVVGGLTMVPS